MFTGLIEDVGRVYCWRLAGASGRLTLKTAIPLKELSLGSSIAVNGACLTVSEKGRGRFVVDVSPETLRRTNMKDLKPGSAVNLERPLRLNDRLGGHWVTGHVDGTGVIEEVKKQGRFTVISYRVGSALAALLVPKGSVAVDGISLTVNDCGRRHFSVAIVPFTLKNTNLQHLRVGDKVNIELDLIGKYVRRLLTLKRWRT